MPNLDRMAVRERLASFDFGELFTQELGWDYPKGPTRHTLAVGQEAFPVEVVAEKRGVRIFHVGPRQDGNLPDYPLRRAIDAEITKLSFEHLNIFTDSRTQAQVWQYVARHPDRPAAFREYRYDAGHSYESLLQKLDGISFSLDDEEGLTLDGVTRPLRDAMDRDVVTKRFYERFRKEQLAFQEFIRGLDSAENQRWYSSVMLNRLMFVWFIQKKGFLDADTAYLRTRLRQVQERRGGDQFHSFYRSFLLRLFHEGLGSPGRTPELDGLLGRIPYLNGGIFQKHPIEESCPEIQIPDAAFERIFAFFDDYDWHLDDRPISRTDGREINPDVLGYIFEKYINQKQMGAYYTKEDITGYISKNTIIPFLFDRIREVRPEVFARDGYAWRRLRADPDRYIYPAVRKGVDLELPAHIASGLHDVAQRDRWNETAAAEFALPTEIWRETVARRQRCTELRQRLRDAGQPLEIDDLITLNLDVRQVAQDVIEGCDSPDVLSALWTALAGRGATEPGGACHGLTILDPTCGSGAFLFAALNVLKPLYEACLQRMRAFLADWQAAGNDPHPNLRKRYECVLGQVDGHPNADYFILKTIILANLFGVDIMDEAVEICKLRLFLKLAAQVEPDSGKPNLGVEPLPDIDFNIRAGNTLVGFASLDDVKRAMGDDLIKKLALPDIQERAGDAASAYGLFRQMQTEKGMDSEEFRAAKTALRQRLGALEDELNRYLAEDYGVNLKRKGAYEKWLASHRPFHWLVDFYGIMQHGGFDVIIGNPPYVVYSEGAVGYRLDPAVYSTLECRNLYGYVTERSLRLVAHGGRVSLIVQLTALSAERMRGVQELMLGRGPLWLAAFPRRPESMFDGVEMPVTIITSAAGRPRLQTTRVARFYACERFAAMDVLAYQCHRIRLAAHRVGKMGTGPGTAVLEKIMGGPLLLATLSATEAEHMLYYQEACRYWTKACVGYPFFRRNGGCLAPPHGRTMTFPTRDACAFAACLLNSSLFYWFYSAFSDCEHINDSLVASFPVAGQWGEHDWCAVWSALAADMQRNSSRKTITTKQGHRIEYDEMDAARSKPILDTIDRVLARHYGFTDEELDFIINYDIKYRMGLGGTAEAAEEDEG